MNGELSLETAVETVQHLPKLCLPQGVVFETEQERKIVTSYSRSYRGQKFWLENLVLKRALPSEAVLTNYKYFQPQAQIKEALLNLVGGLYSRCDLLQEAVPGVDAPIRIWLVAIAIKCRNALADTGLLGKSTIFGKSQFYLNNTALLDIILEASLRRTAERGGSDCREKIEWLDCPETYLAEIASELARQDEDFAVEYWNPYCKVRKRWDRKIRDCPVLQSGCILSDGGLSITGDKKKLPDLTKNQKSKTGKKGRRL